MFVLGPERLQSELQWVFSKCLSMPNFESWVTLIIRDVFNTLVGEVVFRVPPDAPSRQPHVSRPV
jgi:hypothetical protein